MDLLLPRVREPELILPSYVKLDMAFGVGSGSTLFDKSRYRSHGAISGASWAAGAHGYCLDFNPATPSYVEIPAAHTQLNFTSEDFSFVIRLKVDDITAIRNIYQKGQANVDGFYFLVQTTGVIQLITCQSGALQSSNSITGSIVFATWYTVGISRNGSSIIYCINGVDKTSGTPNHTNPATCARSAKIGIHDDKAQRGFDGKIEFFRIFGGIALSTSEHLAWHNALA